jgi:hypothetical protein
MKEGGNDPMILEVEEKSNDFKGPSLKIIPETNEEIFLLGNVTGTLEERNIAHTHSSGSGAQMFVRFPLREEP